MPSGGGARTDTTICQRCLAPLVYSERRKTWLSTNGKKENMFCPFDGRLSPSALLRIHKPVAGENR